jgi:hypothetical protein
MLQLFLFSPDGGVCGSECDGARQTYFEGFCYEVVTIARPFADAEAFCTTNLNGGHLCDVQTQRENDFIFGWS